MSRILIDLWHREKILHKENSYRVCKKRKRKL